MPTLVSREVALSFDDIVLIPQLSNTKSREDADVSVDFCGFKLRTPIISANMSTVTDNVMASAMFRAGGLGIMHRYADFDTVKGWIKQLKDVNIHPIIPSIGIGDYQLNYAMQYREQGADFICVDVAHADNTNVIEFVKFLSEQGIKVIAGNVSTVEGFFRLEDVGAVAIKIGQGSGSNCSTRVVTGMGVPQLTALKNFETINRAPTALRISDGGVRSSGDIAKALAFGADVVMTGSLLAGTSCACGGKFEVVANGKMAKPYMGMASKEAIEKFTGKVRDNYMPEGVTRMVDFQGQTEDVVRQLTFGIKSSLSYCGASNLEEFKTKARYQVVSRASYIEGTPHGLRE